MNGELWHAKKEKQEQHLTMMGSGHLSAFTLLHRSKIKEIGLSDVVTLGFRWSRGFVSPFTFGIMSSIVEAYWVDLMNIF